MDLYDTALPIREGLLTAHQAIVDRWSRPGTWWTAPERLAIVEEVRRARDAEDVPPPWVPASSVEGLINDDHLLPPAAVDVIWRLTNHPGTLTADWYRSIVAESGEAASGVTPPHYTELVAVVAQVNCLDRFADGLSITRAQLPEPVEGQPTRTVPDRTMRRDHWVPTVDIDAPQVIRALSGVPEENTAMFILSDAQYIPIDEMGEFTADRNSLTRMQVELVAARTSKLNECFY